MTVGFDSYTVRRQLAGVLRAAREAAGLSTTEAAVHLGVNQSTVSRIENAQLPITERQLSVLAQAYGVGDVERQDWQWMLLDGANGDRWWNEPTFADYLTKPYAELIEVEDAADVLTSTHLNLVPGLLQTPEYYRALCRNTPVAMTEDQVEAHVEIRRMRQRRLEAGDGSPLRCMFFLPEPVLGYRYGDEGVHLGQLRHLRVMCDHPRVDVRLIRSDQMFEFIGINLYEFSGGDAPVAYGESLAATTVVEKGYPFHTQRIRKMIAMAHQRALPPAESAAMIEQRIANE